MVMRHAATIAFAAAVTGLVVMATLLTQQAGRVTIAPEQAPEDDMQVLKTTWTSSRGIEEVSTPQLAGETDEAHAARHNAKVALQQELWPPV